MTCALLRGPAVLAALLVISSVALADPPASAPEVPPPNAPAMPRAVPSDKPAVQQTVPMMKPDVGTLLFGTPQWDGAPAGVTIRYTYDKVTAGPSFGASFKDQIVLTLGAGDDAQSRVAAVQMFSGPNRKPAGPFRSDGQNPVLLVVLEDNIQELSKLFKANPRYLKNAIRKAWRDNAKVEPAQDTIGGKQVAVTRVTVMPFVDDPESDKMMGLQTMAYVVDIANDVPGTIAVIDIHAAAQGKPLFSETLRYEAETKP